MRHLDASVARKSFSQLYHQVAYGGERVVIDHHGKGLAALVPVADLEHLIALQDHAQAAAAPNQIRGLAALLEAIRPVRADLEKNGVRHLAIFGSFARGTEREVSDVDVLLDIDPEAHFSLFDLAQVRDQLVNLVGREVDVVTAGGLNDEFRSEISRDAVYLF